MDDRTGIIMHIHNIIGMGDLNTIGQRIDAVLLHHCQDLFSPANQNDLGIKILRRLQSAQHGGLGCVVTAHGVQYDLHRHTSFC